jgi:hypothetical protein
LRFTDSDYLLNKDHVGVLFAHVRKLEDHALSYRAAAPEAKTAHSLIRRSPIEQMRLGSEAVHVRKTSDTCE